MSAAKGTNSWQPPRQTESNVDQYVQKRVGIGYVVQLIDDRAKGVEAYYEG